MECSFAGCVKKAICKGLCQAHYKQMKDGKELAPLQVQHHGLNEKDRFMKWLIVLPNGCWRWIGSHYKPKNANIRQADWYGQFRNAAGMPELAHRSAWRLFNGAIPSDLCVLHRCDNPYCVSPEHLFLGTHADNMHDMWDKGRQRPGLLRGSQHGMSKLTETKVRVIRESPKPANVLAAEFGVSASTMSDIISRKTWKHVK